MGVVMFYHLTRSTPEQTAAQLLPRALQAGWRVMVRSADPKRLAALDAALWRLGEEDFLPHGLEGGPQDADQPVLLGTGTIANGAEALMLLDGSPVDPAEAAPLQRVWVVFDGMDEAAVGGARGQWKTVVAAGIPAQYWSEESGRWEKKAEK